MQQPVRTRVRPADSPRSLARPLIAALGLVAVALWPSLPPNGPVLLAVLSPQPGTTVGVGGVELLVRFAPQGTAPETFRALLNGADVTDQLTTGQNGCHGQLSGLLPGENVLRLEVFGRLPWNRDRLFEQARELHVRMQPPLHFDRG